jgi:hypothetical protein
MWPFNTGDCLIEVTAWEGLAVYVTFVKDYGSFLSRRDL